MIAAEAGWLGMHSVSPFSTRAPTNHAPPLVPASGGNILGANEQARGWRVGRWQAILAVLARTTSVDPSRPPGQLQRTGSHRRGGRGPAGNRPRTDDGASPRAP
ncbi:hypothetical protein VFPBJ_08143 [Purpureocillium lilacinum]|uniref:Uncharacterized protein n=1 Tax=Purpureocillium lilacinum TaxID=33203 RepID=A0A179GJY3_PURLI|nr:hypothetical protein VFPBJ_08143 [Purpureocillium lilacinum]